MRQDDKLAAIRGYAKRLKLTWLASNIDGAAIDAQKQSPSYDDFLLNILREEVAGREYRLKQLRYKNARLPMAHQLDRYDFSISNGLGNTQLNQLRELHWVEEGFNLMLAGPSGVGKTYIAAGLCADAIENGYKAYFRSMEEVLSTLRMKDMVSCHKKEYKNLCSAQIIVIDDLMNITVDREEGNMLFAFINSLYESTSFIITTNRSPAEWAGTLNDEVLATAILDRLLYKCELIQLSGKSYRMSNRRTIFENKETNKKH
ncbi:MAG: IS21-like element helper ATPase IstB [Proteiniphilum sp.]